MMGKSEHIPKKAAHSEGRTELPPSSMFWNGSSLKVHG